MTSTDHDLKDAEHRRSGEINPASHETLPINATTDDELDKEVLVKDKKTKKDKESAKKKKKKKNIDRSDDVDDDDDEVLEKKKKKKKNTAKALLNFLYDPKRKTVLGRSSLNWAKLSAFYTIFYLCLATFFFLLVYVFAIILDRNVPRYSNEESTMAVRSTYAVVGMGFRPQPIVDENLIEISDDPEQQERIVKSMRLFRDIFLVQKPDAKVEECTAEDGALDLPVGTACQFSWNRIVNNPNHPCSDENMFGFKNQQPCILVKLNKVYGWTPIKGVIPWNIQNLRGVNITKSVDNADVAITCSGTNAVDKDFLTDITYYSLGDPLGSSKYGVIPNYYFPYRNAKDHVQPFVLVQFNKLPLDRLVSITCRAWAPGIEHDTRSMSGMVSFQLYRAHRMSDD